MNYNTRILWPVYTVADPTTGTITSMEKVPISSFQRVENGSYMFRVIWSDDSGCYVADPTAQCGVIAFVSGELTEETAQFSVLKVIQREKRTTLIVAPLDGATKWLFNQYSRPKERVTYALKTMFALCDDQALDVLEPFLRRIANNTDLMVRLLNVRDIDEADSYLACLDSIESVVLFLDSQIGAFDDEAKNMSLAEMVKEAKLFQEQLAEIVS